MNFFEQESAVWLAESLEPHTTAANIASTCGRYEECVSDCADSSASAVTVYSEDCMEILRQFETDYEDEAKELTSDEDCDRPHNWESLRRIWARAIAVAAAQDAAKKALRSLRLDLEKIQAYLNAREFQFFHLGDKELYLHSDDDIYVVQKRPAWLIAGDYITDPTDTTTRIWYGPSKLIGGLTHRECAVILNERLTATFTAIAQENANA